MELPYFKHEQPLIGEYCGREAHVKCVLLLFNCIATGNKVSEHGEGGLLTVKMQTGSICHS